MSPKRPSDSDSDSDAPEAVSLSSSKKVSEARTKAIKEHERNQRAKRKNENRERDRLLKEEKAKRVKTVEVNGRVKDSKGKGKAKKHEMAAIERMERAMKDAADEDGDEDDDDSEEGDEDEDEDRDEMEEDNSEEEEWAGLNIGEDVDVSNAKTLQLPDHIFAAAATTVNDDSSKGPSRSEKTTEINKKKRKTNKAKDLIIGSRAIKTLSSSDRDMTITGRFQPPPEANKFVERQLQLHNRDVTVETTPSLVKRSGPVGRHKPSKDDSKAKGNKVKSSRSKGWNRVPVNLGSMRSGGPAKNFVRGATSLPSRA